MTPDFVIDFCKNAMQLALMLSLPMLSVGLVVGLMVSVFQATTQIQEMTLQFIPKILAISITMVLFAPWLIEELVSYTSSIITNFPDWVRVTMGLPNLGLTP